MSEMATRLEQGLHDGMVLCPGCSKRWILGGLCVECKRLDALYETRRKSRREFLGKLEREQMGLSEFEPAASFEAMDFDSGMSPVGYVAAAVIALFFSGALLLGVFHIARSVVGFLLEVSR